MKGLIMPADAASFRRRWIERSCRQYLVLAVIHIHSTVPTNPLTLLTDPPLEAPFFSDTTQS